MTNKDTVLSTGPMTINPPIENIKSPAKVKIAYWKLRGAAAMLRYQMAYMGADYEMIEYECGDGPEFSRAAWNDVKPTMGMNFPNLPYVVEGDFKIAESTAVHRYLADKFKPGLLGTNAQNRA